MSHDCAGHFEQTGSSEVLKNTAVFRGQCTECGQELVQVYDYHGTFAPDGDGWIDRLVPEPVERLHRALGRYVAAASAGENRRAAEFKQRFDLELDAVIE